MYRYCLVICDHLNARFVELLEKWGKKEIRVQNKFSRPLTSRDFSQKIFIESQRKLSFYAEDFAA